MQSHFQAFTNQGIFSSFNSQTSQPDDPSTKAIDDLMKLVKLRALQVSKKRDVEDLALMELLNGFDIIVTERKPKSDIANSVYRLILRNERDKQRMSIQDLTKEINDLKQYENEPSQNKVSNMSVSNAAQFDFQGSFGEEEQKRHNFLMDDKENLRPSNLKQKLTFPKISLDNVLDSQKNESFLNRCLKLSHYEESQNKKRDSLNRSATPSFLNADLNMLLSDRHQHSIINQSQNQFKRKQLPKLNLSGVISTSPGKRNSSVPVNQNQYEKAIDSNRTLAFTYYAKRLLLKGWRAFFNNRLENSNKQLIQRIAEQKFRKNTLKKVFRHFYQQAKQHPQHGRNNVRARVMYNQKTGTKNKYLRLWMEETKESITENRQLYRANLILNKLRKRQLFNQLKRALLKQKLSSFQNQTSEHIYKQRYLKRALIGLRYLVEFRRKAREQHRLCKTHNRERRMRKVVKSLKFNQAMNQRQREFKRIAFQVRNFNLLKLALRQMKENRMMKTQFKKLESYSTNYYNLTLMKSLFEILKKNLMLSKAMFNKKFYVDVYYQKKIKFQLFNFLMAQSYEFSEKALNIIQLFDRQRQRRIITALRKNVRQNRVQRVPQSLAFHYFAYHLVQHSFVKLSDQPNLDRFSYPVFMSESKVPYYKELRINSDQQLRKYVMMKIIRGWKQESSQIRTYIRQRQDKTKKAVMRKLRVYSMKNSKLKYLLKTYLTKKQTTKVRQVFSVLSKWRTQNKMKRLILSSYWNMKNQSKLRQSFLKLKIYMKRKLVRRNQAEAAVEIHERQLIEKSYTHWRTLFTFFRKQQNLDEKSESHSRQRLLVKYFTKILNIYSSINKQASEMRQFQQKRRKQVIKKALCGLLQNILDQTHKRSQYNKAQEYYCNTLQVKSIKVWQHMMPEMRQKNRLIKVVRNDRQHKMKQRIWTVLKMYQGFKTQKQTTDYFMTKAVQSIRVKRFFKQWYGSLNKKTGAKILEHFMDRARLKEFFTRVQRKRQFENAVCTHMKMFHTFKLLEFVFVKGFNKNVMLKYKWEANKIAIPEISLRQRKREVLRRWVGHYQRIQWEIKAAHFALVAIKNQIAKKYFNVLKSNYQWKLLKRKVNKNQRMNLKQKYFRGLRYYIRKVRYCRDTHAKMLKQSRKDKLRYFIDLWASEVSEIHIVRQFTKDKIVGLKQAIIQQWLQTVRSQRQQAVKLVQFGINSRQIQSQQVFNCLKTFTKQKQQTQSKIKGMQQKIAYTTKSSIVKSLMQYLDSNRTEIKVHNQIKKKVHLRMKRNKFAIWKKGAEAVLTQYQVFNYLNTIAHNIMKRKCMIKWVGFVEDSQQIELRGEQLSQERIIREKQSALLKLKQYKDNRSIDRERKQTIQLYWVKKSQLRLLTYLKYAAMVSLKRKSDYHMADQQYALRLINKALIALAFRVQNNSKFKGITQQFRQLQRQKVGPYVFHRLRDHSLTSKEDRIRNQFATEFRVQKLLFNSFKTLYQNMIGLRNEKIQAKKAIIFNCEKLQSSAFNSLSQYTSFKRLLKVKRQDLFGVVQAIDQNNLRRTAFHGLMQNKMSEKERSTEMRGRMVIRQLKQIFTELNNLTLTKIQLKKKGLIVKKNKKNKALRQVLTVWMRALDNESRMKVLVRSHQSRLMKVIFDVLYRKASIAQSIYRLKQQRLQTLKQISFSELKNQQLKSKKLKEAEKLIQTQILERTQRRSFMGLKFQTFVQRNLRVLLQNKERLLAIKSFNGWKYQIILDKTLRNYLSLKHKTLLDESFRYWHHKFTELSNKKNVIRKLGSKKDTSDKQNAINAWKKKVFREKFIDLLQTHLTEPHQKYIASRCLTNWKRYAKLQCKGDQIMSEFRDIQSSLIARRYLRVWFEASLQSMPARILGQRLSTTFQRALKEKAFDLIRIQGVRNEYLSVNIERLVDFKHNEIKKEFFDKWRKEFNVLQLQKVVREKVNRKVLKECFLALRDQAIQTILKKQIVERLSKLSDNISEETKLHLIKTFKGYTSRCTSQNILVYYFNIMKIHSQRVRDQRMNKDLSESYYRERILQKYLFNWVKLFYTQNEDRQYDSQGDQVFAYKTLRKSFAVLQHYTLEERKLRHAREFYNEKISKLAFYAVLNNMELNRFKGNLNTRMMHMLKKKCISMFKVAFTQWRMKFEHRQFKGQAVSEYRRYRRTKLKRIAFDYFVAVVQQQLQVKDILRKAQLYFEKKRYLRTAYQVMQALREQATMNKTIREEEQDKELNALKLYAKNLMVSHLKAWRRETKINRNRQKRSKMYAVFSALKFYTKERVLLKKYLNECNQYTSANAYGSTEVKMMSTQEMRDNAARFSAVSAIKSNFQGVESVSSSQVTPFTNAKHLQSTDSRILRSNHVIMNYASPGGASGLPARAQHSSGSMKRRQH